MASLSKNVVLILSSILYIASLSCATNKIDEVNPELTKLIIDTDAGVDDALAISLILGAEAQHPEKLQVVGITSTYGNTVVDNVVKNILRTLMVNNRTDIPVYRGAHKPLINDLKTGHYYGADGFGETTFQDKLVEENLSSENATSALVKTAKKHAGKLSVLTLGPLTNVGMALKLDPEFSKNVRKFYVMGGSVHKAGNVMPNAEFNFFEDPESDLILFNAVTEKNPIILLPLDTVDSTNITKNWRENVFGTYNSDLVKFLNKIEKTSLQKSENQWGTYDALCAAVMLWPNLINKSITTNILPIVEGQDRGKISVDYEGKTEKPKNTLIVDKINEKEYMSLLVKYVAERKTVNADNGKNEAIRINENILMIYYIIFPIINIIFGYKILNLNVLV